MLLRHLCLKTKKLQKNAFFVFWAQTLNLARLSGSRSPMMITALEQGTSAAVGGAIATAVLFPLDLLRTKLAAATDKSEGSVKTVLRILRTQGAAGLFGGLTPKLFQSSLGKFLYFIFYTAFVQNLQRVHPGASTAVRKRREEKNNRFPSPNTIVLQGTVGVRLSGRGVSSSFDDSSGSGDDANAEGRDGTKCIIDRQEFVCYGRSVARLARVCFSLHSARDPVCAV